jgi:hypothetical protein
MYSVPTQKWKKKYHAVGTISKSNRKIVERGETLINFVSSIPDQSRYLSDGPLCKIKFVNDLQKHFFLLGEGVVEGGV